MNSQEQKNCQYPIYEKYLAELAENGQSLSDSDKTEIIFYHVIIPAWLIHVISDVNFICVEYSELWSLIHKVNQFISYYENDELYGDGDYEIYRCVVIPKKIERMPQEIMKMIDKLEALIKQYKLSKEQTKNNQAIKEFKNVVPLRL